MMIKPNPPKYIVVVDYGDEISAYGFQTVKEAKTEYAKRVRGSSGVYLTKVLE